MNKKIYLIILFPIALLINFISSNFPDLVEKYYSLGINKVTIKLLSTITGIVPFSLYELTMYIIFIFILVFVLYLLYIILKNPNKLKLFLVNTLINLLALFSVCYFLFVILWGINYNKTPLEYTLITNFNSYYNTNIDNIEYNKKDLENLYTYLIDETNKTRELVKTNSSGIMIANTDYKGILSRAYIGYKNIDYLFPNISLGYSNPKYILSSEIMNYTGIIGIYFPFTGEANINVAIPDIYIPSTSMHEMAHQRGFANEDEANFISYLACINHPDIDFKYSGLILALNHTANALYKIDSDVYKDLSKNISDSVKNDLSYNRQFWNKYEGNISDISNDVNNSYLKANGVSDGVSSYGKMVNLLLTYYKLKETI